MLSSSGRFGEGEWSRCQSYADGDESQHGAQGALRAADCALTDGHLVCESSGCVCERGYVCSRGVLSGNSRGVEWRPIVNRISKQPPPTRGGRAGGGARIRTRVAGPHVLGLARRGSSYNRYCFRSLLSHFCCYWNQAAAGVTSGFDTILGSISTRALGGISVYCHDCHER